LARQVLSGELRRPLSFPALRLTVIVVSEMPGLAAGGVAEGTGVEAGSGGGFTPGAAAVHGTVPESHLGAVGEFSLRIRNVPVALVPSMWPCSSIAVSRE
jgi:hypothetical protein